MKNIDNYRNSISKYFLNESDRFPLWVLDDFVIDPKNLNIEWFLLKDWFFGDSKVVKYSAFSRWWENLFISESDVKKLDFYEKIKNILIEWNSIIRKKVFSETGELIWRVFNYVFSTNSFSWISIIVRKSFFWLFFYWSERIISKKDILDVNQDWIIIVNKKLAKAV